MTIRFTVAGVRTLSDKSGGSLLTDESGNIDMNKL